LPIAGEILISHLNSPNDVCVRSGGSIIFTDPWYGRMRGFGVERPCELGFQGVYRVANDGSLHLLVERDLFDQPKRPLLFPRQSDSLRQRLRESADPRLPSRGRRIALGRRRARLGHPIGEGARRPG
jgi:hypothetical protein